MLMTSNHEQKFNELTNTALDSVPRLAVGAGLSTALTLSGYYAPGELYVRQFTDEHGAQSREYADKEGKLILRQVQEGKGRYLKTVYAYDELGHLRYLLPPKAGQLLSKNNWLMTTAVQALVFRYHYDERGRAIVRQVPGAAEEHLVYDPLDRVVLVQDGKGRAQSPKQWRFTKYDAPGRPVLTGTYSSNELRAALQTTVNSSSAPRFESRTTDAGNHYYSNQAFPVLTAASGQALTVTYYDDYDFDRDGSPDVSFDSLSHGFPARPFYRVRGQVTAAKTRVLGSSDWLQTVTFYDDRYRALQTQSQHHLGGTDVATTRYSFGGQALATHRVHRKANAADLVTRQSFRYDHAGRLLATSQQINQEAEEPLAQNTYNELGQLQSKVLGNKLQQADYRYNIRGWLTHLNDAKRTNPRDLFGLELSYDHGFEHKSYNGNVAGVQWQSYSDFTQRAYGYRYDTLNRLVQADYRAFNAGSMLWNGEQQNGQGNFDAWGMGYDANGNLLQLKRRGLTATDAGGEKRYGDIDRLTYTYEGNRLRTVDDWYVSAGNNGDFEDNGSKATAGAEYGYDADGNLTIDKNKGITAIAYNYLNLPQAITFGSKGSINFTYAATGEKLRKTVKETNKPDVVTNYLAGMVYRNDTLQFMPTQEGRALYQPTSLTAKWAYEYQYKDHLGNLRLAFRQQAPTVKAVSLEPSQSQQEEADFDNVAETRHLDAAKARTGTAFAKLNAAQGKPLGPLRQFEVQRGDSLNLSAYAYFPMGNHANLWPLLSFVGSWFTPQAQPGSEYYTGSNKFTPYLSLGLAASVAAIQHTQDAPIAYLKYIVYDKDSAYVTSGLQVVSELAQENWELLHLGYKVEQDGFVQVFLSNDSDLDAYFDDMAVSKTPALIVQENHYDPWGLNLIGIEKQGRPNSLFQYNNKEKQEEFGLNWLDYGARGYDSQLGRFHSIDAYAEKYINTTPYSYASNNPIKNVDINGDSTYLIIYGAGYLNSDMEGYHDVRDGFMKSAGALAESIRNRNYFDPDKDDVIISFAPSTEKFIEASNSKYKSGPIAELTVFSHGTVEGISLGGEAGNTEQLWDYDKREINQTTMNQIDKDNFEANSRIILNGCNIGGTTKSEASSSFGQKLADYFGGNRTVKAFTGGGGAEFPTRNGDGQSEIYNGKMIRTSDRANQQTKHSVFRKDESPQTP